MGHMFETSQVDFTMRWQPMKGKNVLGLPGTDHAGIATQMPVERHLAKDGIDRRKIGRKKVLEHVWAWKEEYGGRIVGQLKRVGASCDWTRERFTMDPSLSRAVTECFVRLCERGLVYRGEYSGLYGTYHHLSGQHLRRYLAEFTGRHNVRDLGTAEQIGRLAVGLNGRRLPWKMLAGAARLPAAA